jgi:hypothetical protein
VECVTNKGSPVSYTNKEFWWSVSLTKDHGVKYYQRILLKWTNDPLKCVTNKGPSVSYTDNQGSRRVTL